MDRQPVLAGERLLLRPLERADWPALFAVAADPQLWAHHPAHDRWQEPVFRAFFDDALARGGALAVIDRAGGAMIGSTRFQDYVAPGTSQAAGGQVSGGQVSGGQISDGWPEGGQVEIGWTFLARSHWGTGCNAEMKRLMLAHALGQVARAVFIVGRDNIISRRAMEKIGGRLTGEIRMVERAGDELPHVVYEITRAGFAAGPLLA
jgi:RimJ/RimL family protein N-acetyltransferase